MTPITGTASINISSLIEQYKSQRAATQQSLFSPTTTPIPTSSSSALTNANNAMFQMTDLMSNVRLLSRQAGSLNASNAVGVDALRTRVEQALVRFNDISKTFGSKETAAEAKPATGTTTAPKPATLAEMQSTLADMQTNLRENVMKVGAGIQKALAFSQQSATVSFTGSTATNSSSPLSTLWANFSARQSGSTHYA